MKKEEYKKLALRLLAYEQAAEDIDIFPASVQTGDKVVKRSEWQDGWNDCVMALSEKAIKISDLLNKLPDEITDYILRDVISASVDEGVLSLWINCHDLFFWACADCEEFEPKDLLELNRAYQDSPENGAILWVCRIRKMRPQQLYYKYLKNDKKLFDACGEERQE